LSLFLDNHYHRRQVHLNLLFRLMMLGFPHHRLLRNSHQNQSM
jgi:hypothetical protein